MWESLSINHGEKFEPHFKKWGGFYLVDEAEMVFDADETAWAKAVWEASEFPSHPGDGISLIQLSSCAFPWANHGLCWKGFFSLVQPITWKVKLQ